MLVYPPATTRRISSRSPSVRSKKSLATVFDEHGLRGQTEARNQFGKALTRRCAVRLAIDLELDSFLR